MKCFVCGVELGFWAKLHTHSDVEICKECQVQAKSQLGILVGSVGDAQPFKPEYALGWINKFDETCGKYAVPEDQITPLRFVLLNNIFKLVENEDEMIESDLQFLLDLTKNMASGNSRLPTYATLFLGSEFARSFSHGSKARPRKGNATV